MASTVLFILYLGETMIKLFRYFVILLLSLTFVGCLDEENKLEADSRLETPSYQYQPKDETEEEITKPSTYEEAVKIATKHGRDLFLVFYADWCGPCQKMKRNVWSNESVKKALDNYVFYMVNTDRETKLVRKFRVQGIPAYGSYRVSKDGDVSTIKKSVGYKSPDQFISWINR